MRALVLYINGKKVVTAGVNSRGVLAANITWVNVDKPAIGPKRSGGNESVGVSLGGLDTAADEHATWCKRQLKVGDKVCVEVVEVESVDRPRSRQRRDRRQELRQQKQYVRKMAKDLGWTIRTR
jgi:hypothetical protein